MKQNWDCFSTIKCDIQAVTWQVVQYDHHRLREVVECTLLSGWVEWRLTRQQRSFSLLVQVLNMYSKNYTVVKWQGLEWQKLPLLIGALLNAHHALHPWQISFGSYHGSHSVWRCCSLEADVQSSLGVGEPRSSLRGCSETALKLTPAHLWQGLMLGVPDRILGKQLWKRFGVVQWGEEGDEWENGVESTLPVQWWRYQPGIKRHGTSKGEARLLPASRTLSPHPFLFPLLPRRGADVAHSCKDGVIHKPLQSPLSPTRDGLGMRRKRSESRREREG